MPVREERIEFEHVTGAKPLDGKSPRSPARTAALPAAQTFRHAQHQEPAMQFTPYLNFDGNCAAAFIFYAELFRGSIVHQSSFAEIPASENMPPMPESAKSRIMHVHLQMGQQSLMGSDAMPGADASCGGYQPAQGLWVSIQAADVIEGRRLFDALAQDGQVVMPFAATFWSPGFGMTKDRFGTPWMVNATEAA